MSKDVKKYYGADKKKKIANLIIASLLLISVAIVLVSIFGQNVGNFIISVDTEVQVSLSLSEENNFSKPTARLAAKGIKNQTHATYSDVPKNIMNLEGSNNDEENKRYIAYSFYVKNSSSVSFD